MKRQITSAQKKFLQQELRYLTSKHVDLANSNLDDYYEVADRRSNTTVQVVLSVGAVLIGIGFLLFIASNWSAISSYSKFFIIFIGVIAFYFAGWKTEAVLPKTSRALYYLGAFLFGSGIFLIGQTFHLGGDVHNAFLFWALGIFPLAVYLKDQAVMTATIFFIFLNSTQLLLVGEYTYFVLIAIPSLYLVNHVVFQKAKWIFVCISGLFVFFTHCSFIFFEVNQFFNVLLLFVLGLVIYFRPFADYKQSMKLVGQLMFGGYGIVLTFPFIWERIFSNGTSGVLAITFAVLFASLILWLVREGSLFSIFLLCCVIFRFYADISYDFLPKSLFFIVGGLILVVFGYWFERSRRGVA